MKFSLNSLNQFIDLKSFYSQPDKLADKLSSAGFEVEGWEIKQCENKTDDIIFEIDILPHRPDCLSHFGLSRELFCLIPDGASGVKDGLQTDKVFEKAKEKRSPLKVEVLQAHLCSRYTGQAVLGVEVQPSPLWLKSFLKNLGFKSINNIVDMTNYCLIQWGQPLHAFDLDRIGSTISVDFSQKGEHFLTLDDQKLILTGQELCIRDAKGPLALAGVIGGRDSGIHKATKNIFLESACFAPSGVRASSKRFHIETDSSYRFSRGVSADNTLHVLQKAIALIQSVAKGQRVETKHDIGKKPPLPQSIAIKTSYVERRLGFPVLSSKFQNWMKKLNCSVSFSQDRDSKDLPFKDSQKDQTIWVRPPLYRVDLKIKEDLIEEYARLESYNNIPETPHYAHRFPKKDHKELSLLSRLSLMVAHEGFYQAINHSFISQVFSDHFLLGLGPSASFKRDDKSFLKTDPLLNQKATQFEEDLKPVFIQNPLSQELNMMRISLLPSLFKNAQKNSYSGRDQGRLFEIGKVFYKTPSPSSPYKEDTRLGFIAWGQKQELWDKPADHLCIYDLKATLRALLKKLHILDYEWQASPNPPAFIHPFQYMTLKVGGHMVAYIGTLHPQWAEHYKVCPNMALGEIILQGIDQDKTKRPFKKISPFPAVKRDLTFILPKNFPAGDISQAIKKIAGPICHSVKIFDIYEGSNLKEGEKAVSFRLHLQSDTKTFTEEILTKLQNKLIKHITSLYPAHFRKT